MAIVRTLCLAMVVALVSGCFVGSELNNAKKLADGPTKPGDAAAAPAAASGAQKQVASATPGKPAAPKGPSWWQTAHSLGSEESKSDIVPCKRASGVEFMEREDCLARGGATP